MFKPIVELGIALVFSWAATASAASMPPVSANGQLWLQPLDFVNNSWNTIASVCDANTGICNGSLNGNDLTGWTWAGIPELNSLFTSFGIPGFTGSDTNFILVSNSTWATAFLNTFLSTSDGSSSANGFLRVSSPFQNASGFVADDTPLYPGDLPHDIAGTGSNTYPSAGLASDYMGGWFYRADVPNPATIPLIGLGLAALGLNHRKRVVKQLDS